MCYGGGAGFGGYAGYKGGPDDRGFIRRIRFFDFDMNQASILTYKMAEYPEENIHHRIDEMTIAQGGKAAAPPISLLGQHWPEPIKETDAEVKAITNVKDAPY